MADRLVDYCCPRAVEAYPAPCPEHGQDRPDVETHDDEVVLFPPNLFAGTDVTWDMLPGPLCHFTVDEDGTVTMFHDPQTHARPEPPPRGLLGDLWDALRALPSWWQSSLEGWARWAVYSAHRPTHVERWSSAPGPAAVYCCHCSRGRAAVPWPCPPVLKVLKADPGED